MGVHKTFSKQWKKQLAKSDKFNRGQKANEVTDARTKKKKRSGPSLSFALLTAFGGPFAGAGLLKLVHDSLIFVGPLALNKLIFILRDPTQPLSLGLRYVAAIFFANFVMSLCLRQYFWWCYRVGMRLRSAVTTSVYTKALKLSTAAMSQRTTGEITNLMSVDASRLQELSPYLHAVWYSFYQISIALYFLWQQMGISSLAGIAVILLLIPFTGKISKIQKGLQSQMAKVRDERIKVSNEVLGGMKVIKFQAWEAEFEKRINEIRDKELAIFRKYCIMQSVSGAIFTSVPLLVSIVTFTTYIATGNKLDVATALTSLALFEILRFPLFMLPNVLNNLVEAKVSIDRVQGFLMEPEREPVSSKSLIEPGLFMTSSTLIWDGKRKSTPSKGKGAALSAVGNTNRTAGESVVGAFTRRINFLMGRKKRGNAQESDIENGVTSDDDTMESGDEDDETDGAPLILGDTEESQLMSVFRAQVDASEARIRDLERDLKDLRSRRDADSVQGSKDKEERNKRIKSKMTPTSSYKSLVSDITVHNAENAMSVSPPVSSEVVAGLDKADEDNTNGLTLHAIQPEQSLALHSKITDESDDKWRTTHNPLMEETKEEDMSSAQEGKGSDRLLTLSRISLSAKLGGYTPPFIQL